MDHSLLILKNIQILVEIFKIKNNMSPTIVSDLVLPSVEINTTLSNKTTFF